jgi:glutaredoxin
MMRKSMTGSLNQSRGLRAFRSFACACALVPALACAQYKTVGPDGRVTYSDQPPAKSSGTTQGRSPGAATAAAALPYDVQQAVSRYPVVIYTGGNCAPCNAARTYLLNRGVPFNEKTISSEAEITAFKQQSPTGTAPLVTVGTSKLIGFSQTSLGGLLDAAGYPAASKLPREYQNPPPTALIPAAPSASSTPTTAPDPTSPAAPPPPPVNAPPGFRF